MKHQIAGNCAGDDPHSAGSVFGAAGGERVDGRRDPGRGQGEGQRHEREDRLPGHAHPTPAARHGIRECQSPKIAGKTVLN